MVNEVRRQVEKKKEIAIAETKKKKWVSLVPYVHIQHMHSIAVPTYIHTHRTAVVQKP